MTDLETRDIAEEFAAGAWAFTPDVVEQFDDHVSASVPCYDQIQALIAATTDWLPADGVVADLGASTGRTAAEIQARHPERPYQFHLYDESTPMLERARRRMNATPAALRTHLHEQRVQDELRHVDADLTVSLFTLQFLRLEDRVRTLRLAHEASGRSGRLIVAEKVRPLDGRNAEMAVELSHDEKSLHGISDEGIRAKARALRGVLVPYSEPTLRDVISAAGWVSGETLFRWHSWVVVGAWASAL